MTAVDTSLRSLLITQVIEPAWVTNFRQSIVIANGGDVQKIIKEQLVSSTDIIALIYDGATVKEGNEDGSYMRGESPTVENFRLSMRLDRTTGLSPDEARAMAQQVRSFLLQNPRKAYLRHNGIGYSVKLGDEQVTPTDAGFDQFDTPITLS